MASSSTLSSLRNRSIPSSSSPSRSSPQPQGSTADRTSDYFLKLSEKVVHFDPVTKGTAVFFDDIQCQIFVVRDNGSGGVSIRSPILSRSMDIFFEDKGPVLSIKFSPDLMTLGVQRSNKTVEFLNLQDATSVDLVEYSQMCRARGKILGFCWVSPGELVLITDTLGLESYQIRPERKDLKSLKNYTLSVEWFLYTPPFLLLASGKNCNVFYMFWLKPGGNYQRFPKFEVDTGARNPQQNQAVKLMERDAVLAPIYGALYLLIIRQVSRLNAGAEVVMYKINRDGTSVEITDVLLLECNGRFAINVLDNLIVVHHQQSKMSKVFDLKLNLRGDGVRYHFPISSHPIETYHIKMSGVSIPYDLYSSNWAVFLPNIIVDAKLGCLWRLELQTDHLVCLIPDKLKRVEFLLLREAETKVVLLKHLTEHLNDPHDYSIVPRIFDLLNTKLKSVVTKVHNDDVKKTAYLDQSEVYRYLLLPLTTSKNPDKTMVIGILIEYIKSLTSCHLEAQYYVHELVVNSLVQFKMFHLLRHLVENHVFLDSKPFACLLLSLENVFPPAFQMALDMLKRIGNSSEEQAEILLAKFAIFPAIKVLQATGGFNEAHLPPRKFLEPALDSNDKILFYSVYRFFQLRNIRLRGNSSFLPEELCDDIVSAFDNLFPDQPISCDFVF